MRVRIINAKQLPKSWLGVFEAAAVVCMKCAGERQSQARNVIRWIYIVHFISKGGFFDDQRSYSPSRLEPVLRERVWSAWDQIFAVMSAPLWNGTSDFESFASHKASHVVYDQTALKRRLILVFSVCICSFIAFAVHQFIYEIQENSIIKPPEIKTLNVDAMNPK